MKKVHPSSIIHPETTIGEDVEIGPFCTIGKNVKIGQGTTILAGAHIHENTFIGENNKIFHGAIIGIEPQDLKYESGGCLIIGNNNTIREYTTIHRSSTKAETIIGNSNLLMAYCHVAHDCKIGDNNILANNSTLGGHVIFGNNINSGGLAAFHQFVEIGDGAFIAGSAAVTQDIPPYCMVQGDRAKIFGLNIIGLKRAGIEEKDLSLIKKAFRLILKNNKELFAERMKKAKLDTELTNNEYSGKFIRFIEESKSSAKRRGICGTSHEN